MSKFILRNRTRGFTIVSNEVIKVLKSNVEALGVYVHLLSLPDEWSFYKTQLCSEYKIGIKKLERILKVLKDFGLVKYGQERNDKGQFETFYLEIYDLETIAKPVDKEAEPVGHSCRTVETVRRSGEAIQQEVIKEESFKATKHIKRSYENEKRHDFAGSMNQMAREKECIQRSDGFKRTKMPDHLRCLYKSLTTTMEISL